MRRRHDTTSELITAVVLALVALALIGVAFWLFTHEDPGRGWLVMAVAVGIDLVAFQLMRTNWQ